MKRNLEVLADNSNLFCQDRDISKKEEALQLVGRPGSNAERIKGAMPYDYY
jgi:hypothetical protein